ncbi:helix-turn-helix domain-containing protein [Chitinophaga pendula]|uniref:helix-turn-helix domain-containing protein n=1 Tax=Chitinophaga TaxID=79328 RepID=UPI000BB0C3D3|nr:MULTISPECIES: helix-turn-helix domain-containing protein [Chitinophaga]ASZ13298.1 hypothetical protein CK934_21215 [Chitinophaga sp. MD30]UCJ09079.1 helix-turn-helix domain-containing protein [Chitinophaga pendula]
MKKNTIALHKHELKSIYVAIKAVSGINSSVQVPHRDDHYMFIIQRKGYSLWELDFNEVALEGACLCYVTPGQVHRYIEKKHCEGWITFVETGMISKQCREIFDTYLNTQQAAIAQADDISFKIAPLIEEVVQEQGPLQKSLLKSLAEALITEIASKIVQTQNSITHMAGQKYNTIVRFKQMIVANFKELKQVKAYAALLNITPLYLNEIVKEATGFPASYWITQEIVLEAKRLLHYTPLDIKQIAYELGYEDHTYFSRFFKKNTGMTASVFRSRKP